MDRYIVFDVETPNGYNRRMSAIGIAIVEQNMIVNELVTLVNPEERFDRFNIQLTGITPGMAAEAPTFEELWPIIAPIFDSGLLMAHNAPFDMSVLAKCLRDYHIDWRPTVEYICTCQMGRRCYPNLANHKLDTLCTHLNISLEHHQAGSDSHACAELLLHYKKRGLDINRYRRIYDLAQIRTIRCG